MLAKPVASVTLDGDQWGAIVSVMSEAPVAFKIVAPLIFALQGQYLPQLNGGNEPEPPEPPAPPPAPAPEAAPAPPAPAPAPETQEAGT